MRGCKACFSEAWQKAHEDVRKAAAEAVLRAYEASIPFECDGVAEAMVTVELIGYLDRDDQSVMAGRAVVELRSQMERGLRPDLRGLDD